MSSKSPLGVGFWRLLAATAVSNVSDGIGRTVLPLLAATLTRDPLSISTLTTLSFLPWLLCALPAGALVDRHDRRRSMIIANLIRTTAFGALAGCAVLGGANIAIIYAAAFVVGVAETVYDSAGRALLPGVVRRDQLERGNSLLSTVEIGGQTYLGAPIGALLFSLFAAAPLFLNATGFVLAALVLGTVAGTFRPIRHERNRLRADIRDGVRWLLGHRFLRRLTLVNALTAAAQTMANSLLVLYALDVLHLPDAGYGIIMAIAGVGGVIGGLTAPLLSAKIGRAGTLVLTALAFPLAIAGVGLTRNAVLACVLYGLAALLVMTGNVLTMSLRQALIPEELFGRVQGAYRTLVWGGIPLGALAGGALAAWVGVSAVFVISGLANLVIGGWMCHMLRGHRREIEMAFAA